MQASRRIAVRCIAVDKPASHAFRVEPERWQAALRALES